MDVAEKETYDELLRRVENLKRANVNLTEEIGVLKDEHVLLLSRLVAMQAKLIRKYEHDET